MVSFDVGLLTFALATMKVFKHLLTKIKGLIKGENKVSLIEHSNIFLSLGEIFQKIIKIFDSKILEPF